MKFLTDNDRVVDVAYLHGYDFGDRLLEDVYFECVIENDRVKVTRVAPWCEAYFEKLNKEMWLKAAQEAAEKQDVFSVFEEGSEWSTEDAYIVEEDE